MNVLRALWRWPRRGRAAAAAVAAVVAAVAIALLAGSGGGGGPRRPRPAVTTARPPVTTATAPAPPSPPPPAPKTFALGVNVNRLFNDRSLTAAQIDAELTAMRATGATNVRTDALWELAQPDPGQRYDWAFDDGIATALAGHGLAWLPIIDYAPAWATGVAGLVHALPRTPGAYAAFAAAFAGRYGPGGAFWRAHPAIVPQPTTTYEIWNEPDDPTFSRPSPDPARYAALYAAARAAVRQVQPGADVIVGGLTKPSFLTRMFAADPGLAGNLDGVAIHPYRNTPDEVLGAVAAARRTLVGLREPSVPLSVTEVGWTTSPAGALNYLAAAKRPAYIERVLTALASSKCGVASAYLYTWITPDRNPADRDDWFGISGSPPDVAAFTAATRAAAGVKRTRACKGD